PDGYGVPLVYQQRLFARASQLAGSGRAVVATTGRDEADPAGYFLRGRANAEVDVNAGLMLPAEGGVYVSLGDKTPGTVALSQGLPASDVEALPGGQQAVVYAYAIGPEAEARLRDALDIGQAPDAEWQDGLELLGVGVPRSLPGELAAEWQVSQPVTANTMFFNQVLDDGGKQWFDSDAVPLPSAQWRPGDRLITLSAASLPADAPLQAYWWFLGVYGDGGRRVALSAGPGEGDQLRVARVKGGTTQRPDVQFQTVDATFGEAIRLTGYALQPNGIVLWWSDEAPVDGDYTVFVHVLGPGGAVIGQADGQPEQGHYPTSLWDPGEAIYDLHVVSVPAGSTIEVGLYELVSGRRLLVGDGADHVTLRLSP
ncbi:MAG TPA: hypothetical protein VKU60_21105, partial [Chloroflexota bacterium]|nr:hypothetical protein [Chloroflexota bacterium]